VGFRVSRGVDGTVTWFAVAAYGKGLTGPLLDVARTLPTRCPDVARVLGYDPKGVYVFL